MNKSQLIAQISAKSGLDTKQAGAALDALMDSIRDALANGDSVALTGFGTFSVKARAERTGRNPKTGERLTVAATKAPHFKAGKPFKDKVALA